MSLETLPSSSAVDARISTFERKTKSTFVMMTRDKTYGAEDWRNTDRAQKKALYWKIPTVPSDGIPFLTIGRKVLACHQGKKKHRSKCSPDSNRKRPTKKMGCPAQIRIHHVIKFPDYQVGKDRSVYRHKLQKKKLRENLLTDPNLKAETVYYVEFPALSDHTGHPTDGVAAGKRERPDPLVKQEIMNLTRDGVRKVSEMKRHINTFVKNVFEEEEVKDTTRRRYHPLDRDIRNIMDRAKTLMRLSKDEQENIGYLLEEWQEKQPETTTTIATTTTTVDADLEFKYHSPAKIEENLACTLKHEKTIEILDNGMAVISSDSESSDDGEAEIYVNLPPRRRSKRHGLQHNCAMVLKQIIESVYQLKDAEYLEELRNDLHCKLIEVQLRTPFATVIQVGSSSPQKRHAIDETVIETIPMKKEKTTR